MIPTIPSWNSLFKTCKSPRLSIKMCWRQVFLSQPVNYQWPGAFTPLWSWMNVALCVCAVSKCVHMCPRRIDRAQALWLIGSHGDGINRLGRLTFDTGNTWLFDWPMCSLSPLSVHLPTHPHFLTFFDSSRALAGTMGRNCKSQSKGLDVPLSFLSVAAALSSYRAAFVQRVVETRGNKTCA